jgi:hypothetical protein
LTPSSSFEELCAQPQHEEHDEGVEDESSTEDLMREALAEMFSKTEPKCGDGLSKEANERNEMHRSSQRLNDLDSEEGMWKDIDRKGERTPKIICTHPTIGKLSPTTR